MRIQINDGELTYYTKGVPIGVTIPISEEIKPLIVQLEAYVNELKTPETLLIEQTENEKQQALTEKSQALDQVAELENRIQEIIEAVEPWASGVAYQVGQLVRYQGRLYRVLIAHTSQEDWPPNLVNMFVDFTSGHIGEETGVPQAWEQPTHAGNAYKIGDKVSHNGNVYVSQIDANTTIPGTDERWWKKV